ncbi:protein EARLY FLOWERING 5-like [Balaenoptera musculus]|uniref:Protein EARLY FLOWERING 5-like n=1 Tax=Balaenoptera musculus TaxID=9771 RepID=A0A8B8V6D2_BALMU|nr:protein EARLY FLOWERING 5-like [Balaenoptera musculus]
MQASLEKPAAGAHAGKQRAPLQSRFLKGGCLYSPHSATPKILVPTPGCHTWPGARVPQTAPGNDDPHPDGAGLTMLTHRPIVRRPALLPPPPPPIQTRPAPRPARAGPAPGDANVRSTRPRLAPPG